MGPSPPPGSSVWNTLEHWYVVRICKISSQTNFGGPQCWSFLLISLSAVKVTFTYSSRFGIEIQKSDPRIRFPIKFWPKKKKTLPQYVLKCQSYPKKTNLLNIWFYFSILRDHVFIIFISYLLLHSVIMHKNAAFARNIYSFLFIISLLWGLGQTGLYILTRDSVWWLCRINLVGARTLD